MERQFLAYNIENTETMYDVLADIYNETNRISSCGYDEKGRLNTRSKRRHGCVAEIIHGG